jgi:phosphoserine phosphatase
MSSCPDSIRTLLKSCDAVCFDVDSTVQLDESIDVLAAFAGKGEQVSAMTNSAMSGSMKFEDTLKARLDLILPSRQMVKKCLQEHPVRFSPKLPEFVALLTKKYNKKVFLVSGGFTGMIYPIADALDLPRSHVFANVLLFSDEDEEGSYKGFDPTAFTSRSGGKARAIEHIIENILKKKQDSDDDKKEIKTIMIGDGATDLEAKPPANAVIGYGGVVVREKVKNGADWFVMSFKELIDVLES